MCVCVCETDLTECVVYFLVGSYRLCVCVCVCVYRDLHQRDCPSVAVCHLQTSSAVHAKASSGRLQQLSLEEKESRKNTTTHSQSPDTHTHTHTRYTHTRTTTHTHTHCLLLVLQ